MEWSLVKESAPVKSDSESVYIAVDANPTFTAESKATSSVQFIENTVQPVVYEQFGSQLLTQAFPVPALPVLEPVVPPVAVDSVPMSSYDDAMGQIQGDPMLSETSSVIGAQKEIESAYKLVVDGSGINNGQQQWEQEWTYGTSS